MPEDNEHIQMLIAARDREVTHRRGVVEALAEKHDRGDTEHLRDPSFGTFCRMPINPA
jgi:hypothetical protein